MDGEAEALHRQMHHDGCAIVTKPLNSGITDNRRVLSPGAFVERTIVTRAAWNHGGITVYTDGIALLLHTAAADKAAKEEGI